MGELPEAPRSASGYVTACLRGTEISVEDLGAIPSLKQSTRRSSRWMHRNVSRGILQVGRGPTREHLVTAEKGSLNSPIV